MIWGVMPMKEHNQKNDIFKEVIMKKRILSLFAAFVLFVSILPSAVLAEGTDVAEMGGDTYETLQEILDNMEEAEITLLDNVEEDITVYAATTIHMNGHSITGKVEADSSLTLTNGTVKGNVIVDVTDLTFTMTAPADAEAAIDGGLEVKSGSCSISGAKIGIKDTLYMGGNDLSVSGTEKAVELSGKASPDSLTLYGSADENGNTADEAVFDGDTYKIGTDIAKKLSNKQQGGSAPDPAPTLELTEKTASIYRGQTAAFNVNYTGKDKLTAYIQGSTEEKQHFNVTVDESTGELTVATDDETPVKKYTLYVHEENNTFLQDSATIEIKEAVIKDSSGNYYEDVKTAFKNVKDGDTLTVVAQGEQLQLNDGIYADTGDNGVTLDLKGHSLGGYSLNVGGTGRSGKLIVIDSSGGNGAVGLTVRNNGTLIFKPDNVNTRLLQLDIYGGKTELRGGNIASNGWTLHNGVKLSDIIPSAEEYAYRLYRGGNSYGDWVKLADAQNNNVNTGFALAVVKCEHNCDEDDEPPKCYYCGETIVAYVICDHSKYFTDFQAAIDYFIKNCLRWGNLRSDCIFDLMTNIRGDYTITDKTRISLRGQTINGTVTVSGRGTVEFIGWSSSVENVIMSGGETSITTNAVIKTLTIENGATWRSILPSGYGYKLNGVWYDVSNIGELDSLTSLQNVTVKLLPVSTSPSLYLNNEVMPSGGRTVTVGDELRFGVNVSVNYESIDEKCYVYYQKQGDAAPTKLEAVTHKGDYHECDVKSLGFDEKGVYDVWCEVSKDGYTRTSEKYRLAVKADLSKAVVELEQTEFTYSGNKIKPQIKSVTLNGNEVSADDYTVSGVIEKINAGSYKLRIEAKDENVYSGFVKVDWEIKPCILNYNVELEPKPYDATTSAAVKSILFYKNSNEAISLPKEDYYIVEGSVKYDSAEVGAGYGDKWVDGDAEVRLADTDNAKNYSLNENSKGIIKGYIKPALIADADKYHGYKINIRYNDKSEKIIGASAFGAPSDDGYKFVTDGMAEKYEFTPNMSFDRAITLSLKENVTKDDIGKQFILNFIIYTSDGRYTTNYEGKKTIPLTVEIVDKSEPELTVNTITAVYDGNEITSDKIKGTAKYDDKEIKGTWSFKGTAPKNAADKKCTVVFTPTDEEIYKPAETEVDVDISPRNLNDIVSLKDTEFTYNRNAQKAGVIAVFNGTTLAEGDDYETEFPQDITNAGDKTVKIKGKGNFGGEKELKYTIKPKDIGDNRYIEVDDGEFRYNGSAHEPGVLVKDGSIELERNKDYTVEYKDNTDVGWAKVWIIGINNYSFKILGGEFQILKADAKFITEPSAKTGLIYNGKEQELVTAGTADGGTVQYSFGNGVWSDDIPKAKDAGSYIVFYMIEGDKNHNTTLYVKRLDVSIGQKNIANAEITLGDSLVYNTTEQTQGIKSVTVDNLNVTYDISGNTATDAGEYTLTVTANGNFKGEKTQKFTVARKTVTANVTVNGTYTYNGKAIEPTDVIVKDVDTEIPKNEYTLSYADNTNAGTAAVTVADTNGGNYAVSGRGEFVINKASVKVKPKDITKVYGDEPKFELESDSELITQEKLAEFAQTAEFTSVGSAETAPVNKYEISVKLKDEDKDKETNLIINDDGTGMLTVIPAKLTIKVKDVSREYGAENPELEVEYYSGFKNGEDESVLSGELKFSYNGINEQTAVGIYREQTTAWGLTSDNYTIDYLNGDVEITKILVNASAGEGRRSYLGVVLDRAVEGLTKDNFTVKDKDGNIVTFISAAATDANKGYLLSGVFETGKQYSVTVTLDGTAADATHRIANGEFKITPANTGSGGGGGSSNSYTVSFETNGGSKLSRQTVTRNSVIKEPAAPTREGFDFAGWYTDKELTVKYDFSEKVTKSITLYAAWSKKDNSENQIILTIGEKTALVFGQIKSNDVAPKVVNDRTMLPARFVAENLGANVEWDGDKYLVTITGKHIKTGENITILIYIDSDIAYVNGKEIRLDSPAFVENDRTYTPVRFISEELGAGVEWLQEELKVVITKEK